MVKQRKRLGDLLVEVGIITEQQLQLALHEQKKGKLKLGDQLVDMGLITEQQIIEVLEVQLKIPQIELHRQKINPKILNMINEEMAKRYEIIPLKKEGNRLTLAMADPLDYNAMDDVRISTGFQVEPVIAKKEEMRLAINRYYGMQKTIDQMMHDIPQDERSLVELNQVTREEDSPAARMINQLIIQAVQLQASDIHIDPSEEETRIRFRVDGILRTERQFPRSMHVVLVSRIKIMAQLDIAEKRLPQDGRIHMEVEFRNIDLRVAVLPTVFGEKIVMRILDQTNSLTALDNLGFSDTNLKAFRRMIHSPHGIVLVTGPTGSGKTTTLYSALDQMNTEEVNIITLEDPVEYQIKGVNQVQIHPPIGLTFARGLRSILRQDPNVIMVGEIRDSETAEIALRAAITGHFVFSTLHTNDAVSAITRFIDMGMERFLVSSALIGVVAQRLVRKVCSKCSKTHSLTEEEQQLFTKRDLATDGIVKGEGCSACQNTGYKGRMAIQEVLVIDQAIRDFIMRNVPGSDYQQHLAEQKFTSLFDDGLRQVAEGRTTIEEVYRLSIDLE